MADLGWPEIAVIALLAFAFFGWKRLPDASRSLGRSIRIFKAEISGMQTDKGAETSDENDREAGELGDKPPGAT